MSNFVTALRPGDWVLLSCGHDERVVAAAARRDVCADCGAEVTHNMNECRCYPQAGHVGRVIRVRYAAREELEEKARRRLIVNPVLVRVAEVLQLPGWLPKTTPSRVHT